MVDFVQAWSKKADIPLLNFIAWLAVGKSKFYTWIKRYGKVNEHNGSIPRDFWLEEWEKETMIRFCMDNPLEGYRRLTFMMLDQDLVAVSPSSVWRVLSKAGLLEKWNKKPSKKGTGFVQPLRPHEHWHVDIAYLNLCGTFFYLCSLLDGCSRSIIHWEIREQMTETDVEIIIQKAKEKYQEARPRIISDNGPQFISKDFKEFIRISGMTHVRTSPYYPQSNGKIERFHKTIKGECIRVKTPLSLDDARRIVAEYIDYYNTIRLHSAIGYIAPVDKLNGRDKEIFKERDRKLETAREQRRLRRQQAHERIVSGGKSRGLFLNKVGGWSDEPFRGPFSQPLSI